MNRVKLKSFLVPAQISVKDAMRRMNEIGEKILFVIDDDKRLKGALTDGDIRRWVLKGGKLGENIEKIYNANPTFVGKDYQIRQVKQIMLKQKIEWIPVVDQERRISEVLLWDGVFGNGSLMPKGKINVPVVIMAGGKGTRLDPFTRILPKPLIPIGDKAIIEIIMDNFNKHGVEEFFVSLHHKSKLIKAYFEELDTNYKVNYIEEEDPLGTAGSLKMIKNKIRDDVFVSNCDIIIQADYLEILDFHRSNSYDMTIVGSFRHFTIPYGICVIEEGGRLLDMDEKPEYDYLVNTGMYLIKKKMLDLIPRNQFFNMTDLLKEIRKKGGRVGVFPIDEKSWIDVGQWEEYQKSLNDLNFGKVNR